MPKKAKILVVSSDVIGEKMAGPGIRYVEISSQLSKWYDVTLYAPEVNGTISYNFTIKTYKELGDISKIVAKYDFIFAQFLNFNTALNAIRGNCRIIYDFYNPLPIEALVGNIPKTDTEKVKKDAEYNELLTNLLLYSRSGSYFVCANERQRDFWVGFLAANRVFMPSRYSGGSIEELVGLLPFGMQNSEPAKTRKALRGVKENIPEDSFILLWAGGIWDWFDPLTAIRGMKRLQKTNPKVKLVFLGTTHPNKLVGEMSMTRQALNLAEELGLRDKNVFFIEGWVDYNDRANYLLEADAAVSLHQNNLETRLSFRTRILDHFWAKLPSIVTTGDWFAEVIKNNELGRVIDYDDVDGFCQAVSTMTDTSKREYYKKNIDITRRGYEWSTIVGGDLKKFIDTNTDSIGQEENERFLHYYIDIASLELLKQDSRKLQETASKINELNTSSATERLKFFVKNKGRANF